MAKTTAPPPAFLALYERLVGSFPGVELKGASMPYTSVNGHMFSFLMPTGTLALRLPAEARAAFLDAHDTRLCEQHGRVMKEYVEVPDALLAHPSDLAPYFEVSLEYVTSLKPKAVRR